MSFIIHEQPPPPPLTVRTHKHRFTGHSNRTGNPSITRSERRRGSCLVTGALSDVSERRVPAGAVTGYRSIKHSSRLVQSPVLYNYSYI